jgi:tetratricopeptide (TPR) repeat protein
MKNRKSIVFMIALMLLFVSGMVPIMGQDTGDPAWILFEKGKLAYQKRDYGLAMKYYQEAIQKSAMFPEAEVAIGDIYYLEGEFTLAEMQYEKAYRIKNAFYIPEDKYAVLQKLASLHESQENYRAMEEDLLSILADDAQYSDPKWTQLRAQIEDNFYKKGLDHVLKLYQFETYFSILAHGKLGWFYYKTGRIGNAIQHLLFALIAIKSELTQSLRDLDSDYEFETLSDVFRIERGNAEITKYLQSMEAFRCLYYLASSVWSSPYTGRAMEIWKLLSETTQAGEYADLSKKQLKKPWIEPRLEVIPRRS